MLDNYADHFHARARADAQNQPALALEIDRQMMVTTEINGHIAIRLIQTSELQGFSGTLAPGITKGRDPSITNSTPLAPWAPQVLGLTCTKDWYQPPNPDKKITNTLPIPTDASSPNNLLDYFEGMFIQKKSSA
ncbi:hypothetical protein V5O48_014524 [Marasmius crinis-equi]|uniref:Uncharacterized protein n=1 Tax=Marasmius crinis-equi TaxID=585013 RepID=A0ABR3EX36_9AGAR